MVTKQRIQRLKDVRDQEKLLVKERNDQYRAFIDARKDERRRKMKDAKILLMKATHDDLANKWRMSLINNGSAHRHAITEAVETVNRFEVQKKSLAEKKVESQQRGEEAQQKTKAALRARRAAMEQQALRREAVRQLEASNREEARHAAEVREARARAAAARAFAEEEENFLSAPPSTAASSSAAAGAPGGVAMGAMPTVRAKVLKYGSTRADVTQVRNAVAIEEGEALKRRFNRVLKEMVNKIRAKQRARAAQQSDKMAAKVDVLDHELQIMQVMDRSGPRMDRVKSAAQVEPLEESPAVAQAFENIFLGGDEEQADNVSSDSEISALEPDFSSSEDEGEGAVHKVPVGTDEPVPASPTAPGLKDKAPKARGAPPVAHSASTKPEGFNKKPEPREIKSSIPKASPASKNPSSGRGRVNKAENFLGSGTRGPDMEVSIVTLEQAETAATAGYFQGGTLTSWVSTGLGRGGDLSEESSVNFELLEDPDLVDRLAVAQSSGTIPVDDFTARAGAGAGADHSNVDESALARYMTEAAEPPAEDVEVTRRSATPLQQAIMEDAFVRSLPQAAKQPLGTGSQQFAMPPSARRDSLQLSLSDEDSELEPREWEEGQVDASWLSDRQGSTDSGGVDAEPSSASTETARHDTKDYSDELESEEDDLNLSNDQGVEEEQTQSARVDIEQGEWARLSAKEPPTALLQRAGLSPKKHHQHHFATEWAELVHVSDEEDGDEGVDDDSLNKSAEAPALSVRLEGSLGNLATTSSVAFESLFIEEDEDGSSSAASTEVMENEEAVTQEEGEPSRTHSSMDLHDFVNKYGDLSGSTPSPMASVGANRSQSRSLVNDSAFSPLETSVASERQLEAEAEAEAGAEAESIASSESTMQDATAQSLRELLGIRDSHEYEHFMRNKVSGKAPTLNKDRRFPRLVGHHDMSLSNELSLTQSDGSPSPISRRPSNTPAKAVAEAPSARKMSPMSVLRNSLSSMEGAHRKTERAEEETTVQPASETSVVPPIWTELSSDSSDDEEESDQLIREIDAMKERLLGTMRSSMGHTSGLSVRDSLNGKEAETASIAALRQSAESQASLASSDSSLSYHAIDSVYSAGSLAQEPENGLALEPGSGSASMSHHQLSSQDAESLGSEAMSGLQSRASEGSMLARLDSALDRALSGPASKQGTLEMEELVEQYLSSVGSSYLTAHSMEDTRSGSGSRSGTLSGGALESVQSGLSARSLSQESTDDDDMASI